MNKATRIKNGEATTIPTTKLAAATLCSVMNPGNKSIKIWCILWNTSKIFIIMKYRNPETNINMKYFRIVIAAMIRK